MVAAVKAFASQQDIQVQRLITGLFVRRQSRHDRAQRTRVLTSVFLCLFVEGTKVRNAQQHMVVSLHKAKEKYDRKCADAADVTSTLRIKTDSFDSAATISAPSSSTFSFDSVSDDNARELAEKLTAGAGQLLTKMWDTTSSFGKSSIERQRSKVDSCLEDVISAEKHYIQTVDFMNAQRLIYEREIKENLHAFQLTEEQRIEYLKDLLLRQQEAFIKACQHSVDLLERLKESVISINEIGTWCEKFVYECPFDRVLNLSPWSAADIEDAFKKLVEMEGSDGSEFDLASNTFYKRMIHIQSLSDQGNQMVRVVSATFTDLIAAEDAVLQSFYKQLQIHENASASQSTDLFGTSIASHQTGSYLADEGTSMKAGWQVARDQVQLLMNVHQVRVQIIPVDTWNL